MEPLSLEEALGIKPEAGIVTGVSEKPEKLGEEAPKLSVAEIKIASRRRRVFELRCLGFKIPEIAKKMA